MEINQEWIDQQRAVSDAANERLYSEASENAKSTIICSAFDAALDALEAAYAEITRLTAELARERESKAKIAKGYLAQLNEKHIVQAELAAVTRERDAAVHDIRLGYGCETCKHVHVGQGEPYMCYLGGCKSPIDWEKWEWRGLCALHGDEKGV